MRSTRMYLLLAAVALGVGGFAAFSLTMGQDRSLPSSSKPPTELPERIGTIPGGNASLALVPPHTGRSDPAPGNPESAEYKRYHEARSAVEGGAQWLAGMNRTDGTFVYGLHPALKKKVEGDDYLRQLGAAVALARAARYLNDRDHAAKATQAIVRFLDDTATAPNLPHVRYPAPTIDAEPLAAAGLLVQAINELPLPQADIIEKSEELCGFIQMRQGKDGSLLCGLDPNRVSQDPAVTAAAVGQALCGLMASLRHRPAPWKLEIVHKALAYYYPWWKSNRSIPLVVSQTPAYAEAFLRTKSQEFADAVLDMNDWLCSLQYSQLDPRHQEWWGGFRTWADGKPVESVPTVNGCACAESLIEACRVAGQLGDVQRYDKQYVPAVELWRTFAVHLQFDEANTQHFDPSYSRRHLLGGFHASCEDGTLRIDYTQQAVSALIEYLTCIVRNS